MSQTEVDKGELQRRISESGNGLAAALQGLEQQKGELISTADSEEKRYQKYLSDLDIETINRWVGVDVVKEIVFH